MKQPFYAIWSDMVAPIRHILKMLIFFLCPKLEPKCSSCWIFRTYQEIPSWLWSSHWSDSQQSSDCLGASDLKGVMCELSPVARDGKGMFFIEVWIMIRLGCVKKRCVQLARCWGEHVSLLVIGDGWGMIRCYFFNFGASGCNTNLGVCLWCGHGNGKWVSNNFD